MARKKKKKEERRRKRKMANERQSKFEIGPKALLLESKSDLLVPRSIQHLCHKAIPISGFVNLHKKKSKCQSNVDKVVTWDPKIDSIQQLPFSALNAQNVRRCIRCNLLSDWSGDYSLSYCTECIAWFEKTKLDSF